MVSGWWACRHQGRGQMATLCSPVTQEDAQRKHAGSTSVQQGGQGRQRKQQRQHKYNHSATCRDCAGRLV